MKRLFCTVTFFALFSILLAHAASLSAQTGGGSGGGISGGGGSGNAGGGGSSSSFEGGTEFGETTDTPTFQGFESTTDQEFIGRPNSGSPFIGRDEAFEARRSRNGRRATTPTSTRRSTAARRVTGTRAMGAARQGMTNDGRQVRAAATTEFDVAAVQMEAKATAFQTRLARLPQLRVAPENVNIQLKNTPSGTVATVSGNVASEKDKKLLQQLILLEPGIDRVENQLNIE